MTVKEQIEILDAYDRGEIIEFKFAGDKCFKYSITKEVHGENYKFDFNSREYRVKGKRWRAVIHGMYYSLNVNMDISECYDDYRCADTYKYNAGNYFRTLEDAERVRDQFREMLTKFHESL